MIQRKHPERRTFLQDRFDILIKRQRSGKATFGELTELDEIVNRDPELREKVIREDILMESADDLDEPSNRPGDEHALQNQKRGDVNWLVAVKSFFGRIFTAKTSAIKVGLSAPILNLVVLI
jgi:hypothetical protein